MIFTDVLVCSLRRRLFQSLLRRFRLAASTGCPFGGSVIFHAHFAGPAGVIPVFVLGLLTYLSALSGSRPFVIFMISLNAAALIFYKYTVFLVTSLIGPIFPDYSQAAIESLQHQWLPSAPPLAISFFVFEFVHYLVDVLKGNPRIKNPTHFVLFGLFWPSVVAGPVKRYEQFLPSVKDAVISRVASEDVMWGAARVSVGFLKKTVADILTAWIDRWTTALRLCRSINDGQSSSALAFVSCSISVDTATWRLVLRE